MTTSGIALDAASNLFIADAGNNRIRRVGDEIIPIAIQIDIKPGSAPNTINPRGEGLIPVAILGSTTFDVFQVDGTTLAFASDRAAPKHDLGDPKVFANHLEDVNRDGFTDLVSHYRTEETGIAFGDNMVCLLGKTLDGEPFEGCDAIRTLRSRGRRR